MKTKWIKNTIPQTEGWYWCKYKGKRGVVICPCEVVIIPRFSPSTFVYTARNDIYNPVFAKEFGTIWFGEKIEKPLR